MPSLTRDVALFLDIDGTLLDIAPHPSAVVVPPALDSTLRRLARALDGAVAVVSGRTLESIDALFAPLRLPAAGEHGAAVRAGADAPVWHAAQPAIDPALLAEARRLAASHPGAWLESKPHGFALHYREAPRHEASLRAAAAALAEHRPSLRVMEGKMIVELKAAGIDKGSGVSRLMQAAPFAGRVPVFVGDDVTDEDGFRAVTALGGIAVQVLPRRSAHARHMMESPEAVRAWLAAEADRLDE